MTHTPPQLSRPEVSPLVVPPQLSRPEVLLVVVEVALEVVMQFDLLNGEDNAHDGHHPKVQALRRRGAASTPTEWVSGASSLSEEETHKRALAVPGACKQRCCAAMLLRHMMQAHDVAKGGTARAGERAASDAPHTP